jgi:hypothetical protein
MKPAVEAFVNQYQSLGLTGTPCSPDDVAAAERHLGVPLPAAYWAYLLVAGHYPPPALVGSDCDIGFLYKMREWSGILLRESGNPFALPSNAVVFLMHQGYQFMYFLADGVTNDPAVFYYREFRPAPVLHAERLSEWIASIAPHR